MGNIPSEPPPGDGFLVLWVGGATAPEQALQRILRSMDVRIEPTDVRTVVEDTNARAPDLVVVGDAGIAIDPLAERLRTTHPGCLVPLLRLAPKVASAPKLNARFGLVAALDTELSPDDLAPKLVKLLRSLSRRPPRWRLEIDLDHLPPRIEEYRAERREGLFVTPTIGALALGHDGSLSAPLELLTGGVERGAPNLTFYERPPRTVSVVSTLPRSGAPPDLRGARVLVIDERVGRGGGIAATLQQAGAEARVVQPDEERIRTNRTLDPSVVVVAGGALLDPACRPLVQEPRLAAASLLVLSAQLEEQPRPDQLLTLFARSCANELTLTRRLQAGEGLAERLETLGAARWLKIVGRCAHDVTLHVFAVTGSAQVTLRGGKVDTASFQPADTRAAQITGRAAIQSLLGLPFGRVLAGPIEVLRDLELASVPDLRRLGGGVPLASEGAPIEPAKKSVAPPRGIIAREVVVGHPSTHDDDLDGGLAPPGTPRDRYIPIEEDESGEQTASYKLGTLEEKLREALRSEPDAPAVPVTAEPARPFTHSLTRPRLSDVPDEDLLESGMPETAAARVAPSRSRPNLWFVAAVVLALGTGAWAAWRLGAVPETDATRAGTEPHVEPIEPVAVDHPDAGERRGAVLAHHETRPVEELLHASEDAARMHDFERSETLARQALDQEPGSARAMYRIAAALLRQRRHQEALRFAERAHQAAPRDPAILVLKAHILVRVGRVREAVVDYEHCLQLSPGFAPAQQQLDRLRRGDAPSEPDTEPPAEPTPDEAPPPTGETAPPPDGTPPARGQPPATPPEPTAPAGSPDPETPTAEQTPAETPGATPDNPYH